jgi:prepilin peptidase CpaA
MEPSLIISLGVLGALCATAVLHDLLFRRIPNSIVLAGMALGLFFQTFAPNGEGLFSDGGTGLGLGAALLGGVTGLALFLPLYALRVLGAGDVKLLAMIGLWLGAKGIACAALWTLLAGGVLSIVFAIFSGVLRQVLANLQLMLMTRSLMHIEGTAHGASGKTSAAATGRLPYALAIAGGTAAELLRTSVFA